MIHEVLIVGSGASAVHAAYPMVEAGLSVTMLDVGHEDHRYGSLIPNMSFLEVRTQDPAQHRYFLGERFEGIPLANVRVGPQLTPPRQYIAQQSQELMPVESTNFSSLSSLALGGMASGWAAGVFPFGDDDLKDFPISLEELTPHYRTVADRIGISGEHDDLSPFEGDLPSMLPALRIDNNAQTILDRYRARRATVNRAGVYMGKPRLAALSQPHRGRGPDRYLDMSFWGDADQSIWRPRYTLQELQAHPNFTYQRPWLVTHFQERNDGQVEVYSRNTETGQAGTHRTKRLVLATGVLGTTRIVLRSLNKYGVKVPFVCNPYTYFPMLNTNMLGRTPSQETHSLAQLCLIYKPPDAPAPVIYGRVHSYRSLLNFKLIKEMPLPFREAMRATKLLLPNLAILALDHEDRPTPDKRCWLVKGAEGQPDRLEITFAMSDSVKKEQRRHERAVLRQLRKLGCYTLKRVWPGYGVSLHYAGTLPMSRDERELTATIDGRLRGTRAVYLVDSALFPYLPCKAMTFTMMANANRIGEQMSREMQP